MMAALTRNAWERRHAIHQMWRVEDAQDAEPKTGALLFGCMVKQALSRFMDNPQLRAFARAPADLQVVAAGYLAEEPLTDAVLALDRHLAQSDRNLPVDSLARDVCERAGVDPANQAGVQELLDALSSRLVEMTSGRAVAFHHALKGLPPAERFSLPALVQAFWPALENLRQAGPGRANPASILHLIHQYEPQLHALYQRHSGRSRQAWEATHQALTLRLPRMFTRYAEIMDLHEHGPLNRMVQAPEGVAVLSALCGLVTLRMPISTPLVCASLGLVGYVGLSPLLGYIQGHLKRTLFSALAAEDAAIRRLSSCGPALRLSEVIDEVQPILQSSILGGLEEPEELLAQVSPTLARLREVSSAPGGPGGRTPRP